MMDLNNNVNKLGENERLYEKLDPDMVKLIMGNVEDIFKAYNFFIDRLFDFCQQKRIIYDSSKKRLAISLLFAKAIKSFYAIYQLCKQGFGGDAIIIFRSLMDIKISMQYLWHSDDDISERFFAFEDYLKYDYIISQKGTKFENKALYKLMDEEMLKIKAESFCLKYKNHSKHYWAGKSFKAMVESLPENVREKELRDYYSFYRLSSFYVHSNIIALKEQISADGIFRFTPNLDHIDPIFPMSLHYILGIIDFWLECIEIQMPQKLIINIDNLRLYAARKFNMREYLEDSEN